MELDANYPIQIFSVTSTLGEITPLRFRYENIEHEIITVNVDEIHATYIQGLFRDILSI